MDISKLKQSYEIQLKDVEEDILEYGKPGAQILTSRTDYLEEKAAKLKIVIGALGKRTPIQASYAYADEFICPACGYEYDVCDVKAFKFCPDCGQALRWDML